LTYRLKQCDIMCTSVLSCQASNFFRSVVKDKLIKFASSNAIVAHTGWSKNGYPGLFWDNFGNPFSTDFNHSFTVTWQKFMRVNVKFFHPPHLYCLTTLPSKTNITANIGVKC